MHAKPPDSPDVAPDSPDVDLNPPDSPDVEDLNAKLDSPPDSPANVQKFCVNEWPHQMINQQPCYRKTHKRRQRLH